MSRSTAGLSTAFRAFTVGVAQPSKHRFSTLPSEAPSEGLSGLRQLPPVGRDAGLERVENLGLERAALERVDLLDARRAGDVDLGEQAADHVDPDEEQAIALERSEEHTSELQSLRHLVCRLLPG